MTSVSQEGKRALVLAFKRADIQGKNPSVHILGGLVAFCCFNKIPWPKATKSLSYSLQAVTEGVRAGTQVRNRSRGCGRMQPIGLILLLCSLCFFIHPRPSVQGWYHPQWAGPVHINHQSRKCPTGLHLITCIFSAELPCSQVTLAVSSWHNTNQHTGVTPDAVQHVLLCRCAWQACLWSLQGQSTWHTWEIPLMHL